MVLLAALERHGVRSLVFSSSATVYGEPQSVPINESARLGPTNPYGRTKLVIEQLLRDHTAASDGWRVSLLRYFNPVGAHPSGRIGEDPRCVPGNLMPFVMQVAVGRHPKVRVFGDDYPTPDGTGVRDYIHVVDLAEGHLLALRALRAGVATYNLGTGTGYSVLEVLAAAERAVGRALPREVVGRRPGDIAVCYSDPGLAAAEIGWRASRDLDDMCRDAWNWQRANPDGFR